MTDWLTDWLTDWRTDWLTDWLTDWRFFSESRVIARRTNSQNRDCAASCYWVCMWRRRPFDDRSSDGAGLGRGRARRGRSEAPVGRGLGRGREGGATAHPRHLVMAICLVEKWRKYQTCKKNLGSKSPRAAPRIWNWGQKIRASARNFFSCPPTLGLFNYYVTLSGGGRPSVTLCDRGRGSAKRYVTPEIMYMHNTIIL